MPSALSNANQNHATARIVHRENRLRDSPEIELIQPLAVRTPPLILGQKSFIGKIRIVRAHVKRSLQFQPVPLASAGRLQQDVAGAVRIAVDDASGKYIARDDNPPPDC